MSWSWKKNYDPWKSRKTLLFFFGRKINETYGFFFTPKCWDMPIPWLLMVPVFSRDSNLLNLHGNVLKARKKLQVLLKGFVSAASNVLKTGAIGTPNKNALELGQNGGVDGEGLVLACSSGAFKWGCIVYYIYNMYIYIQHIIFFGYANHLHIHQCKELGCMRKVSSPKSNQYELISSGSINTCTLGSIGVVEGKESWKCQLRIV